METFDCLIVDDEPDIRELLEITLERMGMSTHSVGNLKGAREALKQSSYRVCLTDMRLPDGDGIELVRYINKQQTQLPVAVITAHGNMESAVEALKAGAFDFVSKPVDLKVLRNLVQTALKLPASGADNTPLKCDLDGSQQLLGSSEAIGAIRAMTGKLARNQAPVHVSGESGTGKELAARMIHCQGPRADKPFIAINCGAVPQELMESEFFGHVKGSFTGAIADKQGLFQAADKGTLFLDEVADLPLTMQVKLLRAIQEKSIRPVGGTREIPIDVRIVSATHRDLHKLVEEGHFRQDLFYRINVIELNLPSLREHREDLPALIDFFLARLAEQNGMSKPGIEADAMQQLLEYDYPGNVRELENILEGAVALHEGGQIVRRDLKLNRKSTRYSAVQQPSAMPRTEGGLEAQLEAYEKSLLTRALEQNQWNRTATAEILGLSLRQLRYKLEKLGVDASGSEDNTVDE